jgi:hypothetical protein
VYVDVGTHFNEKYTRTLFNFGSFSRPLPPSSSFENKKRRKSAAAGHDSDPQMVKKDSVKEKVNPPKNSKMVESSRTKRSWCTPIID